MLAGRGLTVGRRKRCELETEVRGMVDGFELLDVFVELLHRRGYLTCGKGNKGLFGAGGGGRLQ